MKVSYVAKQLLERIEEFDGITGTLNKLLVDTTNDLLVTQGIDTVATITEAKHALSSIVKDC